MDELPETDSGPFCRHFVELGMGCEESCAGCGHICDAHDSMAPGACEVEACDCVGWEEPDHGPPVPFEGKERPPNAG